MIRLITDFDGPIIDVSDRYYRVYHFCLEKTRQLDQPVWPLSKSEFWALKRSRTPEKEIGMISGLEPDQAQVFADLRYQTVHTKPYFEYDTVIPGAVAALEKAQYAGIDLTVMTMRRTKELEYAFQRHDLGRFFPADRCYCLEDDYVKLKDTKEKPLLMERAIRELPPANQVWMVGDTEADLISAKMHNIKVIGLLSGIRDRTQLEHHEPDFIAANLGAAVELVLQQSDWQAV